MRPVRCCFPFPSRAAQPTGRQLLGPLLDTLLSTMLYPYSNVKR